MVDGNISDLFFNSEHTTDGDGNHVSLREEARDFLACQWRSRRRDRLGVCTPTVDELIQDFRDRL